MASFGALNMVSNGTRSLHLVLYPWSPSSSCCRDNKVLKSSRVKAVGGGGGGGPKFKGRQVREKQLTEMIEKKVTEAEEACEGDRSSDECKVAWDEVEEVSQAKAHLHLKFQSYCQRNPETDECHISED